MAVHIPKKQGGRTRGRPTDEKLAGLYAVHSAAEIGEMYGVSVRTVANWVSDVRRREREELAAQEAQAGVQDVSSATAVVQDDSSATAADKTNWIKVIKAGSADRLVVVLEVTPEDGTPYYVVAGATPGDAKAKGSAQAVGTLEEALKKYAQAIRPRSEA